MPATAASNSALRIASRLAVLDQMILDGLVAAFVQHRRRSTATGPTRPHTDRFPSSPIEARAAARAESMSPCGVSGDLADEIAGHGAVDDGYGRHRVAPALSGAASRSDCVYPDCRLCKNFHDRSFLHDGSTVENDLSIGDAGHNPEIMRDEEQRKTRARASVRSVARAPPPARSTSSADVTSSQRIRSGRAIRARAIATRCSSPPEELGRVLAPPSHTGSRTSPSIPSRLSPGFLR